MGDWSVITRKGGSKQWAYKGRPLYTYEKDKRPGETKDDGAEKTWHQAMP